MSYYQKRRAMAHKHKIRAVSRKMCAVFVMCASTLSGMPEPLTARGDVTLTPMIVDWGGDRDGVAEFDVWDGVLIGEFTPMWDCAAMGNRSC